MTFLNVTSPEAVKGLTKLIGNLISAFGTIGVGIIIFTIILKLITLVFDYYSRASMRKSSLKMKEMRPQLEKLQHQYKDNKQLYQQRVMALYKKEGYSVFSSCLPTIITLVIFIIVLNNFQNFSAYSNKMDIYNMAEAYNSVILEGFECDNDIVKIDIVDGQKEVVIDIAKLPQDDLSSNGSYTLSNGVILNWEKTMVELNDKYNFYTNGGTMKVQYTKPSTETDVTKLVKENIYTPIDASKIEEYKSLQQQKVYDTYLEERDSFLWVKNIWVQDRADKNPIQEYSGIKNIGDVISQADYEILTTCLGDEGDKANGYYILIAITILITLLNQVIITRSQKDQMELQTVDGQGAATQKMMMWMMPIMMAVFAFIYTAAFSIYIIISSLLSTLTTLGINKIVDIQINRKKDKETENIIRRG